MAANVVTRATSGFAPGDADVTLNVGKPRAMNECIGRALIAVVNDDPALIRMLQILLEAEGYRTAGLDMSAVGSPDALLQWIDRHDPQVILYDIPLPYEDNWRGFRRVQDAETGTQRRFVLTTTSARAVRRFAGPASGIEIIDLPFISLDEVLQAVQRALDAQSNDAR